MPALSAHSRTNYIMCEVPVYIHSFSHCLRLFQLLSQIFVDYIQQCILEFNFHLPYSGKTIPLYALALTLCITITHETV